MPSSSYGSPPFSASDRALVVSIRRALEYADQFGQAVTRAEVRRYLDAPTSQDQVDAILQRYSGAMWLNYAEYYCLPGQPAVLAETRERAQRAAPMRARARAWAGVMAGIPYVRMIALTGSLAMNSFGPGADIDYLVITMPGRVWTARMLLVAIVRAARLSGIELCPNYILSTDVLELNSRNHFIARELAQMVPLFGHQYYQRMISTNQWRLGFLPNATLPPPAPPEIVLPRAACQVKAAGEHVLGASAGQKIEDWERERKIARLRKLPGGESGDVILNSEQCKGHFRNARESRTETEFKKA